MEQDDYLEIGEQAPLIAKSCSSGHCNDTTLKEEHDEPLFPYRYNINKAPTIILGFECLESTAYYGIATNMVVYLGTVLNGSNASNASNVAIWGGTCYFTPLIGAVLTDSFLGNYKTILISLLIYLLGVTMITLSSLTPSLKVPSCEEGSCHSANGGQTLAFFSGLYLVAFGSGGVKAALLPFGADQFSDDNIEERQRKSSFFSLFYVCLNIGGLFSSTVIVWIQENLSWALGFGITAVCIAIALVGFLLGTPAYHLRAPSGTSSLKSVLQVVIAAFSKIRLEAPLDSRLLYEVDDTTAQNFGRQRLAHSEEFRFLDKAAIVTDFDRKGTNLCNSWRLCTITRVEEAKILVRLLPIWIAGVIFSAAYCQMATTFIQQGSAMNTKIKSFSVPPASLSSFEVVSVMAWVLAYNKIIAPAARRIYNNEMGFSQLQRIGIGQFMMTLAMATAAFTESRRLHSAEAGAELTIAWQLPQYFIVAGSEAFCFIAQHEFFYSQAPETMKSMCTAISLLAISLGSYLSSLILTLVVRFTANGGSPGWIPDDLNKGHLDYYFLLLTSICTLNLTAYVFTSRNYRPKQVVRHTL
ncbi:protein NRT1/ PTR FAMILY 8.3-like isoform X1 [Zingiber officinale]|uniref:protein NRT1/ PTR FAMILY 8.3-like isoform X1 n=1 Tax=Zingiber officinale TaxID=94328 RepID=UPI001C4D68E2|nr:protein NRT1/ PTR FAMILY 8.3-like isoform X1 [Zingiber officinale]